MNKKASIYCIIICLAVGAFNTVSASDEDTTVTVARKKAVVDRNNLLTVQDGNVYINNENENEVDYSDLCSVNEGTLLGIGGNILKDSYLSDEKYGGYGFRLMNERMKLINRPKYNMSKQQILSVDLSSTMNGAQNANLLYAAVNYSYGMHYRFLPDPYFKILVGGNIHGFLGTVYSTRNGNNPMTLHADIDLNLSVLAIYEFRVKRHRLALRYQVETPFMGVLFSPDYDQSYYEIFSLGNTSEIIKFASFHNKQALRNYLTLDFPISGWTVRAGYFGNYYVTSINGLNRTIISNNFMLGFVKEFVAFGGREMRKRNLFQSAYY
ncbi:MAG: DUF3316 domain-containing protein [Tannerella sp.]|nr:DUF3316 domain-containing protein [Tannerella sp.]